MPKNIKMMIAVLALFGAQAFPGPSLAGADKRPLSLDEAVAAGLQSSPGLHSSQMRVDASAAKTRELAAGRLPSLRFSGGYTRLSEVPPFQVS
ncbi:MAG: TolC family protein, partial [Candidatus Aminicenantales bacterium]